MNRELQMRSVYQKDQSPLFGNTESTFYANNIESKDTSANKFKKWIQTAN